MNLLAAKIALGLVLLAASAALGWHFGGLEAEADKAKLLQQHAEAARHVANLAADAAEKARKVQHAWGEAFFAIAVNHQKELTDAQAKRDRILADVLAGNLRLQEHWRGCLSDPEAPAPAGQPDAGAERRAAGAADLVRIGAEFDAYARACRAQLTAERR